MDAVSEVLSVRARGAQGFSTMVSASVAAHVLGLSVALFVPASWWGQREKEPEVVMQVSLGGPEGPQMGGLLVQGARPIQQAVPVEAKRPIEPVRPPADRTPEMIEPTKAPPRKTPDSKIDAKDPRSRTPTKGEELQKGSSAAQSPNKGMGFGLTTGGQGGLGGTLDVANFCCPEYLATMRDFINRNWSSRQGADGTTKMKFVIQKDGRIVDVVVEQSSGNSGLDYLASRALQLTKLPPLPEGYDQAALGVHLFFEYHR